MPSRWLQLARRYPVVSVTDARRAGVPAEAVEGRRLRPQDLSLGDYVTVPVEDYWLERRLDDEWMAAFRFTAQDGHPVISELRIFPSAGREASAGEPGHWNAELRGHLAPAPRGGVTARLVHGVRVGDVLRAARADLERLRRETPSLFREHMLLAPFTTTAARQVLTARRPGRKGLGLAFFAQLAAEYVRLVDDDDPRPAATIAKRRKLSPERVRDMILRARQRGLLTEAPAQGQRGGELTPKARAIVRVTDAAPRRPARRSTPRRRPRR